MPSAWAGPQAEECLAENQLGWKRKRLKGWNHQTRMEKSGQTCWKANLNCKTGRICPWSTGLSKIMLTIKSGKCHENPTKIPCENNMRKPLDSQTPIFFWKTSNPLPEKPGWESSDLMKHSKNSKQPKKLWRQRDQTQQKRTKMDKTSISFLRLFKAATRRFLSHGHMGHGVAIGGRCSLPVAFPTQQMRRIDVQNSVKTKGIIWYDVCYRQRVVVPSYLKYEIDIYYLYTYEWEKENIYKQ